MISGCPYASISSVFRTYSSCSQQLPLPLDNYSFFPEFFFFVLSSITWNNRYGVSSILNSTFRAYYIFIESSLNNFVANNDTVISYNAKLNFSQLLRSKRCVPTHEESSDLRRITLQFFMLLFYCFFF
ncbi:hypothetical protein RCL_jg13340.t1 [Rhizophagus clarus]|uniref:Uncharacterized protein n=1 Tax=Rhizophagus clarus TaxID=94130 RepID=A0A8H3LNI5_9GLOM|nr:hypothetical protein RCL_jg13340.t1 [Rhizophagus clarus]